MRYLLTTLFLLAPLSAQAIIVKNLTEEPKAVEFSRAPSSDTTYVIQPMDSIIIVGTGRIRMAGEEKLGEYAYNRDRFVIWDEEGLVHQQRLKKGANR